MNLTKEKVIDITKNVLTDLKFEYKEEIPLSVSYTEDKNLLSEGVNKGWGVGFDWFDPDYLDGMVKTAIIEIDDISGEPVVLRLATGGGGNCVIAKDAKGKYFVSRNY